MRSKSVQNSWGLKGKVRGVRQNRNGISGPNLPSVL